MKKVFNVHKLIDDFGGVSNFAEAVGICRTTPYRWLKGADISLRNLEIIKSNIDVTLDNYFEDRTDGDNSSRAGVH